MAKVDPRLAALRRAVQSRNAVEKDTSTRKYDPAKQAEGYKTRMEASGVDVEKVTDKRNFIEKALNLKPDQNALFDIFEVINRPQQALFGAIESFQSEDDFGKGLVEGIAGNKDTNFGQILRNAGMSDEGIFGDVGADDILGFVGDVVLDPMDIPLFGASKMVKIGGKMVNYADEVAATAKSIDTLKDAIKSKEVAIEVAQANSKLEKIKATKALRDEAKKILKEMPASLKADQLNLASQEHAAEILRTMKRSRRNALQVAVSGTGTGIKKTLTFADGRVDAFLKKLDAVNAENLAIQSQKDLIKKTSEVFSYSTYYTDIKKGVRDIFDWTKKFRDQGIDLTGRAARVRGAQSNAEAASRALWDTLQEDLSMYRDDIFKHFKENGLYDEFLQEAMNGRTMDDLKAIYPKWTDEQIIEHITDTKLQQYVMLNREYGTKLFGTPADIKGLSHTMTLDAMLTDDSLLYNMGVTGEWKDIMEDYVKTYHKSWHDKYFPKDDMFKEYSSNGKVVTTFRFNEALNQGEAGEALTELRRELTRNKNLADLDKTAFKGLRNNYEKALYERQEMKEFFDNLESMKKAGVPLNDTDYLFVARDNPKYEEFITHKNKIKELHATQDKLKQELITLGTKSRTKTKIAQITREVKRITKESQDIGSMADAIRLTEGKNVVDLIKGKDSIITSTKARFKQAAEGQNFTKGMDTYVDFIEASGKARAKFDLPKYITPEQVEKVSKFSQSQGFANYMATVHNFMEDSVTTVNKHLGANYKFQDGFMTHVMTKEWMEAGVKKQVGKTDKSVFAASNFIGNSKTFGNRAYRESAFASNELVKGYIDHLIETGSVTNPETIASLKDAKNLKMFQDEANKSMADFLRKTPKQAGDAKMLYTVMNDVVLGSLKDDSIIRPVVFESGRKATTPRGYTQISKAALTEKLESMSDHINIHQVMPDGKTLKDGVQEWLKTVDADFLYIDNNINRLIGKIGDDKDASPFLKALDAINMVFKRNKLLSIGFPMRNVAGNMTNMYLAGMPIDDVMTYSARGRNVLKNGDALFKNATEEVIAGFTEAQMRDYETYLEFMSNGFSQVGNRIQDLGDDLKIRHRADRHKLDPRRVYDKVLEMNGKMNETQDAMYRMGAYIWAKDNMAKIYEMGFDTPEQFVRNALFDFTDLSDVEQSVLRKAIPFYTFTKKNLGFQMRNLMQNPQRYNSFMKAFDSTWDMMDLSAEEIDQYSVENFWIPIPMKDKDGKYYTIKSSLPIGDMGEWLSDPFRRLMSSMSPAIRAPFELATNTQTFSGMPISEFKGQKGFQIPELSRGAEYALGLTGLDVPTAVVADAGRAISNVAKGNVSSVGQFADEAFGRGLVNKKDPAKIAERKAYDELDNLETLMRYYKQEGMHIKTMAEINIKTQKNNTQAIINNLRAIQKRGY